jgi:hypothetical protein
VRLAYDGLQLEVPLRQPGVTNPHFEVPE